MHKVMAGTYRTPEEFVQTAIHTPHPAEAGGGVPDEVLRSIAGMLNSSPAEFVKKQANFVREVMKLTQDFKTEDESRIAGMDDTARRVMQGKRLATLEHLGRKFCFPDELIYKDFEQGFNLVGLQPFSGVFDKTVNLPSVSTELLRKTSDVNNVALWKKTQSSGDSEVDRALTNINKEEVERGWLKGPFGNLKDLESELGSVPHISRRFPLAQKAGKIRCIDDFKESGVNNAYGNHDKLWLMDVDSISAVVNTLEKLLTKKTDEVILESGDIIKIVIHSGWKVGSKEQPPWMGKTYDLKQAYKQLCVKPCDRWAACIVCFDAETQSPQAFLQTTLPFGARASVLSFNRVARLLWCIGASGLGIIWSNFFDDFPALCPGLVAASTRMSTEALLRLLGWQFAEGDDKNKPYQQIFDALGVTFDLTELAWGRSVVYNKPGRVKATCQEIEATLARGSMTKLQMASLRGKLQFMDAQIFSRASKSVMFELEVPATANVELTESVEVALKWLAMWIRDAKPRLISPDRDATRAILFSDGACEPSITSCGALLVDLSDNSYHVFGIKINDDLLLEWTDRGRKKQLVTEAELLPLLIARRVWGERIRRSVLMNYVDSEPAKFSLIKGNSEVEPCNNIVRAIQMEELDLQTWSWFSRIPSPSNPADGPSRLDFLWTCDILGAKRYEVEQPKSLRAGRWLREDRSQPRQ